MGITFSSFKYQKSKNLIKFTLIAGVIFCLTLASIINRVFADSSLYAVSGSLSFGNSTPPVNNSYPTISLSASDGASGTAYGLDANNVYNVTDLPNNSYYASISYVNYMQDSGVTGVPNSFSLSSSNPVVNVNGSNVTHNFSFGSKKVTVHVLDGSGNPVSGSSVQVRAVANSVVTDADGNVYGVDYIESGQQTDGSGNTTVAVITGVTYEVCAYASSGSRYCAPTNIQANSDVSADINFPVFHSVNGQVVVGSSIPPAYNNNPTISLGAPDGSSGTAYGLDANGNYTVTDLPNNDYYASISYSNPMLDSGASGVPNSLSLSSMSTVVNVNGSNATHNFSFSSNKVTVHVLDGSGNPVSGSSVQVRAVANSMVEDDLGDVYSAQVESIQMSDENGYATVSVIPGVTYEVCAFSSSGGRYCLNENLSVNEDESTSITLATFYNATGTFKINGNTPTVNGGPLTIGFGSTTGATGTAYATDSNGNYVVADLPEGEYSVSLTYSRPMIESAQAGMPNFLALQSKQPFATIGESNTSYNFEFSSKNVTVHIVDASGNPVTGSTATIQAIPNSEVMDSEGRIYDAATISSGQTADSQGIAVVAVIPGATYEVCAITSSGGRYCNPQVVTVTDNMEVTVQIGNTDDTTAPSITYSLAPEEDANGYNTGRVVVSFSCEDNSNGSGIASCTSPITVDNEGIGHVVDGTAVDNAGNSTNIQANASLLVTAINTGGGSDGIYTTDSQYSGGQQYTTSTNANTDQVTIMPASQAVYKTVRYGNTFSYGIANLTPGAEYTLRLHFNEIYWGTSLSGNAGGVGSRVFNVDVNNISKLSNFDIIKEAGSANKAIVREIHVTANSSGEIHIGFNTIADNAMVNGIELYKGSLPAQPAYQAPDPLTNLQINAGGGELLGWLTDAEYEGGQVYSSSADVDTNSVATGPEELYRTVRYGNFSYHLINLAPNSDYNIKLHFNELYWGTPNATGGVGSRVFNVAINNTSVLSNFDIFAAAGGANKALVKEFTAHSNEQGQILVVFTTLVDNAAVSGIQVQKVNN